VIRPPISRVLSASITLVSALFIATSVTADVSATFNIAAVAEYENNANQNQNPALASSVGITSVIISQEGDTWGGTQGNDIDVKVTVNYTDTTSETVDGALNWVLNKSGGGIHYFGVIFATTEPSDGYTPTTGFERTYILPLPGEETVLQTKVTEANTDGSANFNAGTIADLIAALQEEFAPQTEPTLVSEITVTKTASAVSLESPSAGEIITYTITAENTGEVAFSDVTIVDALTDDEAYVSGDSNSDSKLDIGEVWTYSASYTLTPADIVNGSVENVAQISGLDPNGTRLTAYSGANATASTSATAPSTGGGVVTAFTRAAEPKIALLKTSAIADTNGNLITDAGDTVTYSFTLQNAGNTAVTDISIAETDFSGAGTAPTPVYVRGDTDGDSELDLTETWVFTADYILLEADITGTGIIENLATATARVVGSTATISADSTAEDSAGATTTFLGSISGTVENGTGGAAGVTVELVDQFGKVIESTTTDSNGDYILTNIPAGTYSVRFLDGAGRPFSTSDNKGGQGVTEGVNSFTGIVVGYDAGDARNFEQLDAVAIDPSGVIYNSSTRKPLAGVTVTLMKDGVAVDDAWVVGSATQTTGSDGVYSFFLKDPAPSGIYELAVTYPTGYEESTDIPASGTYTPGLGGGVETIAASAKAPQLGEDTTYYLTFNFTFADWTDAAQLSNGVINNHIPLDVVDPSVPKVDDDLLAVLEDDLISTMQLQADQMRGYARGALARLKNGAGSDIANVCEQALAELPQVLFETDSAVIAGSQSALLEQTATILNACPTIAFEIAGHTDSVGSNAYNDDLSQRRVDAVRLALVALGVDAERLTSVGYGETLPVATNETAAGRQENRRVDFVAQGAAAEGADACFDETQSGSALNGAASSNGADLTGSFRSEIADCAQRSWEIVEGGLSYSRSADGLQQGMLSASFRRERMTGDSAVFGQFVGGYLSVSTPSTLATGTIRGAGLNAGVYGANKLQEALYLDYYLGAALGQHRFDLDFVRAGGDVNATGNYTYVAAFGGVAISGSTTLGGYDITPRAGLDFAWSPGGDVDVTAARSGIEDRSDLRIASLAGGRAFAELGFDDLLASEDAALSLRPRAFCDRPLGGGSMACGYGIGIDYQFNSVTDLSTMTVSFDAERSATRTAVSLGLGYEKPVGDWVASGDAGINQDGAVSVTQSIGITF